MKKGMNFGAKGWQIIFFSMFIFLITSIPGDTSNIFLPALAAERGWSYAALMSAAMPASMVSFILVAIFGNIVRKRGAKIVSIIGLFITGLFFLLAGFAPVLVMFVLFNALYTIIGSAISLITPNTYMSNWFPRKKGVALGWATIGMMLSGVIIVPVCNFLVNGANGSVKNGFVLIFVLYMIAAIITVFVKENPEEAGCLPDNEPLSEGEAAQLKAMEANQGGLRMGDVLKQKKTWLIILSYGIMFMGLLAIMMMVIPRLTSMGIAQNNATMIYAICCIISLPGSVLWGMADQKFGTKKVTVIFALCWAIMLLFTAFTLAVNIIPLGILSVIFYGCLMGGLGNLMPSTIIWAYGRRDFRAANQAISSGVAFLRGLGIVLVSVMISSPLGMLQGFATSYFVLGILSVLAFIFAIFIKREK